MAISLVLLLAAYCIRPKKSLTVDTNLSKEAESKRASIWLHCLPFRHAMVPLLPPSLL